MNKKQKKMLIRIIVAAVLIVLFSKLPIDGYVRFGLFMIPYLVIGYDILQKAFKGIRNKQVFDENFLMAVATVGAILLGDYSEGVAVMLFYQIGDKKESCRRLKEVTEAMAANDDQKIREAFAVYFSSYANAFTSARDEEDKMGGEWRNEDEAG